MAFEIEFYSSKDGKRKKLRLENLSWQKNGVQIG